jgi:hypothetical protein
MDAGSMLKVFSFLAAVLWLISAVLWAFGASVKIRDNLDGFIGDLQRAGRWNSWAAGTACAAALASGVVAVCEVFR